MISVSHWGLYPAPWYMIADANSMTRELTYDAKYLHAEQPKATAYYQRLRFAELD